MSHESYTLEAEARETVGKGSARALRREGRVPAVIYGDKKEPVSISLPYKELFMKIHGGGFKTTVATIKVGGKSYQVLPKDYQLDPVKDFPVHVDFLRVSKKTVVTVEVPVHFLNDEKSPGIKRGGVLNIVRHAVEVHCPADSIPDALEFDLTGLDIGDSIHISAIELPKGVEPTITDRDFTVATIAPPAVLTAEEEAGTIEEADAEAVEVENGAEPEGEGEETEAKEEKGE